MQIKYLSYLHYLPFKYQVITATHVKLTYENTHRENTHSSVVRAQISTQFTQEVADL